VLEALTTSFAKSCGYWLNPIVLDIIEKQVEVNLQPFRQMQTCKVGTNSMIITILSQSKDKPFVIWWFMHQLKIFDHQLENIYHFHLSIPWRNP
jgi:hypothetical protein